MRDPRLIRLRFVVLLSLIFITNPTINQTVYAVENITIKTEVIDSISVSIPIINAPTFNTSIEIYNDNDFLNYSLEGNGTSISPYIIDNFSIETTNVSGIYITNTTKYFVIRDGYVDAHQYGIRISDIQKNTSKIVNVTCYGNFNNLSYYGAGIRVEFAEGIQISNNTCMNNQYGIRISDSNNVEVQDNLCRENFHHGINLYKSQACVVEQNKCFSNYYGLFGRLIESSSFRDNMFNSNTHHGMMLMETSSNTIHNCTFSNNDYNGINLEGVNTVVLFNNSITNNRYGLELDWVARIDVSNTTFIENGYGIVGDRFDESSVTYNLFLNSSHHAMSITYSDYLKVHHNRFINSNLNDVFDHHDSQAYDSSNDNKNQWYDPNSKEGNHWSEHQSGKPYNLDGGNCVDKYPLDENMARIPRDWTDLIFGVVMGTALAAVLTWMAYPKIKARRKKVKRTKMRRKRQVVQPDYDEMVDEEHRKAMERRMLEV